MKSILYKRKYMIFLLLSMLLIITCNYFFQSIEQPLSADPNSLFEAQIVVRLEAENQGGIPYFGICLPIGWSVMDSISYSGSFNGILIYSKELSDTMEAKDEAPDGYYWWISVGDSIEFLTDGIVSLKPQIKTNDQIGIFFLDYMLGDNSNGLNRRRSDHHPISVGLPESVTVTNTNDSGEGSLRHAIGTVSSGGEIKFDLSLPAVILLDSQLVIDRSVKIVGPEQDSLVISASKNSRLLWINEKLTVSLSNLSLTDGFVTGEFPDGAAIYASSSNIFLKNISISNNSAENNGGGIYIGGSEENNLSELSLSNVTISNNSAANNGGGVYIGSSQTDKFAELRLLDVQVTSNYAEESGGGVCCENVKNTTIKNTVLAENNANNGGGLFFRGSALSLLNAAVKLNSASALGGGIFYTSTDSATIVNSIITRNSASDGGGIGIENSITSLLTNVTLADNKVSGKGGAIFSNSCEYISLINSIVWNNLTENIYIIESSIYPFYSNIQDWSKNEGNIDADPLFADSVDYYLKENSPCVDSGYPDTLFYDREDPDNTGYALWPAMGIIRNDMGAYGGHGKFKKFIRDIVPDLPDVTIYTLDFVNENVGWMASKDFLLKTEDGGQNWLRLQGNEGKYLVLIDFINDSLGWAVEQDNASKSNWVLKTEDGGKIWQVQKKLTSGIYGEIPELQAVNKDVVFVLAHEGSDKIYQTTNGGSIWRTITFPDETLGLFALNFKDIYTGIISGVHAPDNVGNACIMKTIDGGNSWETKNWQGYFTIHSLQMMDYQTCFFLIDQTLYRTDDLFETRTRQLEDVTCYYALNKSTIFAIIDRQKFMKSINGGISWQTMHLGEDVYSMIQFVDHLNGWVAGANGSILRTINGGDNWINLQLNVVKVLEIEEGISAEKPNEFHLSQNYPNPFNPRTVIRYTLPVTSYIDMSIYNVLGQKVATLVSERQQAGQHQVVWDANVYSSGIYYYKINTGDFSEVKKMMLIK